jgi:hypothetical protein
MAPTGSKANLLFRDSSLQEGFRIIADIINKKKCILDLLLKSIIKK